MMHQKSNTNAHDEGYQVTVTGRHVQVTEAMKEYATEKVSKIERFSDRIIHVAVTMDIQKNDHRVDILLKLGHIVVKGHGVSDDMYASVDKAVAKIQKQVRRYKDRIQDHQSKGLSTVDIKINVLRPHFDEDVESINAQIEEANKEELVEEYRPHEIVSQETTQVEVLSYDEAIMKMELSQSAVMVFYFEGDKKLKVIHRREDGNFSVIEPDYS